MNLNLRWGNNAQNPGFNRASRRYRTSQPAGGRGRVGSRLGFLALASLAVLLAGGASSLADESAARIAAVEAGARQPSGFVAGDAEARRPGSIAPTAGKVSTQGAVLFVKALSERAIATISDRSLTPEQRALALRTVLVEGFDVDTMSRIVLGRHWRRATPAQQAEYRRLFEAFIVSVYTSRFAKYSGENLSITGALPGRRNIVIVKSLIHRPRPGMPPVAVDWLVSGSANGYRIIDMVVSGVSMAITQRSEFASIIQSAGGNIEGLLVALREKIT